MLPRCPKAHNPPASASLPSRWDHSVCHSNWLPPCPWCSCGCVCVYVCVCIHAHVCVWGGRTHVCSCVKAGTPMEVRGQLQVLVQDNVLLLLLYTTVRSHSYLPLLPHFLSSLTVLLEFHLRDLYICTYSHLNLDLTNERT